MKPGPCPRCGRGYDDNGDGDCAKCALLSDVEVAYRRWWDSITCEGDPARITNMSVKAFKAGWEAREESKLFKTAPKIMALLREAGLLPEEGA